ncbi:hypothetical protein WJX72_010540 [[Myrmecia] bisecta]|uniref:Carboxypeptidase n=1 Tax=[Myrmecia] bisecta TaxID=41462 RepID=A0AAW1PEE1_9CHLO
MFFVYWESQTLTRTELADDAQTFPILLWLQGGPGCASLFGALYELGPYSVNSSLELAPNPGAWNRRHGLLAIDNPVGSGFSIAGTDGVPENEMEMAADLYAALQGFFTKYPDLARRPLFITGESYAGKYVPSIGHFILDMEQHYGLNRRPSGLCHTRALPQRALALGPPVFCLAGLAIGNGLTDPFRQVTTHADTAFYMGLIDEQQRLEAMAQQLEIVQLIVDEDWKTAHERREELLEFISTSGGLATLLDMRRARDYDADQAVDRYLNLAEVKDALGVSKDLVFEGCSEHVGQVLGPDVMRSVAFLLPDLLANMPVLLYQGQFDVQDGPATSESWIDALDWPGAFKFPKAGHSKKGRQQVALLGTGDTTAP